jgi:hypothetical protein
MQQLGLKSLDLDYKESKRTDEYGNQFKYRAKVKDARDGQLGGWAWDVYLQIITTTRPMNTPRLTLPSGETKVGAPFSAASHLFVQVGVIVQSQVRPTSPG